MNAFYTFDMFLPTSPQKVCKINKNPDFAKIKKKKKSFFHFKKALNFAKTKSYSTTYFSKSSKREDNGKTNIVNTMGPASTFFACIPRSF